MARRAATRSDERHAAAQLVECARCGATAEVVKFSPQHTSVQWTAAAVGCCAEFRARAAEGTRSALVEGCAALRDSIDLAVTSGRLAVSPPSYEQAADGARLLPEGPAGRIPDNNQIKLFPSS